ncbi:MAG: hypothetical protein ABW219_04965 [Ilumatobacteraceae bacterium]
MATLDTAAGVVLIDLDAVLVAPPERDLWALAHEDPGVLDAQCARTGVRYVHELRGIHRDTADSRNSLDGLRHYIGASDQ